MARLHGTFVWFELVTRNPARAQAFYGEVLGWKVERFPMEGFTYEMIKVGESTGALEEMLTNVSEFYDEAIESRLQKLVNLIEPVILIVMGGIIATILLSVYLPMFTIYQHIQGAQ